MPANGLVGHGVVAVGVPQPDGGGELGGEAHEPGVVHFLGSAGLARALASGQGGVGGGPLGGQHIGQSESHLVGGGGLQGLGAVRAGHRHVVAGGVLNGVNGNGLAVDAVASEGGVGVGHGHRGDLLGAQDDRGTGLQLGSVGLGHPQGGGQLGDVADVQLGEHPDVAHVNGHGRVLDDVVGAALAAVGVSHLPVLTRQP